MDKVFGIQYSEEILREGSKKIMFGEQNSYSEFMLNFFIPMGKNI